MLKALLYPIVLVTFLSLSARPSRSEPVPIVQKTNPNHTWILLQQQGKPSDRQMQFTQAGSLLPVVDDELFSRLSREPEPDAEIRQTLAQSKIWRIRLVTVNESVIKPGYIDAYAEIDCGNPQLRLIEKNPVLYKTIQSPEDEVTKAIKHQSQIIYRLLRTSPIAARSVPQGEPWRPLATSHPIYQFVCQNPAWRQAIAAKQSIPEAELKQSGFSTIAAGGSLPQHLFAYAWRQVWTDGQFPKPSSNRISILEGRYWLGGTDEGLDVQGDRYRYYSEGGEREWQSTQQLQAIKEGVVFDGNLYWCLSTMEPKIGRAGCSAQGWRVRGRSTPAFPSDASDL